MEKKIKILILTPLVIFIISFSIFLISQYYPILSKYKFLTDIKKLYSRFTPTTERYINYYLKGIHCKPKKYFYDDSKKICFPCAKLNACFGYAWVRREDGLRMNINDIFLTGKYDSRAKYNFFTLGIANLLNCKCNEKCACEDGIELGFIEHRGPVFVFPLNIEKEPKIESIAKELGFSETCKTIKTANVSEDVLRRIECGDLIAVISNNKEVLFGI